MDKVFNVEIDGQITLPDGRKLGPFEETTVNVVQPSEGSSDPILSNAKQTGGIGWTESGEQTVITWDGDTEGKVVVDGRPVGAVGWCLVSDKTPSVQDVIGGTFSKSGVGYIEITAESIMEVDNLYSFNSGTFMVAFEPTTFSGINFPYAGVYFSTELSNKALSLTYGTPDTIHKIDEKYLPASGGVMVVTVSTEDYETYEVDKTFDEISGAVENGTVVMLAMPSDGVYANLSQFVDNQSLQIAIFTSIAYSTKGGNATLTQFEIGGDNAIIISMHTIQVD